jgi:hypothetical protein
MTGRPEKTKRALRLVLEQISCECTGRLMCRGRFLSRKTALHHSSAPQQQEICSNETALHRRWIDMRQTQ